MQPFPFFGNGCVRVGLKRCRSLRAFRKLRPEHESRAARRAEASHWQRSVATGLDLVRDRRADPVAWSSADVRGLARSAAGRSLPQRRPAVCVRILRTLRRLRPECVRATACAVRRRPTRQNGKSRPQARPASCRRRRIVAGISDPVRDRWAAVFFCRTASHHLDLAEVGGPKPAESTQDADANCVLSAGFDPHILRPRAAAHPQEKTASSHRGGCGRFVRTTRDYQPFRMFSATAATSRSRASTEAQAVWGVSDSRSGCRIPSSGLLAGSGSTA